MCGKLIYSMSSRNGGLEKVYLLWLILILLVGFALRLWGISFGLPNEHCRPDESTLVHKALSIGSGDLNPHFFNYPSLHFYFLALLYSIYFGVGWAGGVFAGLEDFQRQYFIDPSALFLIGRCFSALLGTSSVFLTYLIGRHLAGKRAGLLSAGFLSLAFLHVRDSHFLTVDIPATFHLLLAYVFILRYLDAPARRDLFLSGVFLGLSVSTKYSLALFAISVAVAAVFGQNPRSFRNLVWKDLITVMAITCLAFMAGSPFTLLDFKTFWRDLSYERAHFALGHGLDLGRGWIYHANFTLPHSLGWPLFAAALLGCIWLLSRHRLKDVVLLIGLIVYYGVAGSGKTVFMRYMLPLVPFLCVAAGTLLDRATQGWKGRWVVLLAGLFSAPPGYAILQHNLLLARTDTRLLATQWIEDHLSQDTKLALYGNNDFGFPHIHRSRNSLLGQLSDLQAAGLGAKRLERALESGAYPVEPSYQVIELRLLNPLKLRSIWTTHSTALLAREGVFWIVTHEHPLVYSRIDPVFLAQLERDAVPVKSFNPFKEGKDIPTYDPIDAYYVPLAGFGAVERPGPLLKIWRLQIRE